jgi:probable HAF family extracellular repeat protein
MKKLESSICLEFIALTLALVGLGQSAHAIQYHVTDLGTLGSTYSSACGINGSGQVVGYSSTTSAGTHAFLYTGGSMSDLGTLGGTDSFAFGVNDTGQVVGYSWTTGAGTHAFLYTSGSMIDLGTLGGATSVAWGINNSGQIVGGADTTVNGDRQAFVWSAGTMTNLGGLSSTARAINDVGQIVGSADMGSYTGYYSYHPVLWSGGTMSDLGLLGGINGGALDINDAGEIVGYSQIPTYFNHAFLYRNSTMSDLGDGAAYGINNSGQIVGDEGPNTWGFLYSGGTQTDLNTLLDSSSVGYTLSNATAINNLGQIVGSGRNPAGQTHAFLLTPNVPEPSTLVLLLCGLAAARLASRLLRRKAPA